MFKVIKVDDFFLNGKKNDLQENETKLMSNSCCRY